MESEVELELFLGTTEERPKLPPANFSIVETRTFSEEKTRPVATALREHAIRKLRRLKPGVNSNSTQHRTAKMLDAIRTEGRYKK